MTANWSTSPFKFALREATAQFILIWNGARCIEVRTLINPPSTSNPNFAFDISDVTWDKGNSIVKAVKHCPPISRVYAKSLIGPEAVLAVRYTSGFSDAFDYVTPTPDPGRVGTASKIKIIRPR